MPASALTDALRDLWGPGLVFIALCGWLVRRALRAARNESILEEQRLRDAPGPQINPPPPSNPASPSPSPSTPTPRSTSPPPLRVPPQPFPADRPRALQDDLLLPARH